MSHLLAVCAATSIVLGFTALLLIEEDTDMLLLVIAVTLAAAVLPAVLALLGLFIYGLFGAGALLL